MREVEIVEALDIHLAQRGWETRREVTMGRWRADLIATRPGRVDAFEAKRQLNYEVIRQAARWRPFVDYAWVVVPAIPALDHPHMIETAHAHDLGVLMFEPGFPLHEYRKPKRSKVPDGMCVRPRRPGIDRTARGTLEPPTPWLVDALCAALGMLPPSARSYG